MVVRYYDWYIVELTPGKRMGPPEIVAGPELDELKTDDARVLQRTRLIVTMTPSTCRRGRSRITDPTTAVCFASFKIASYWKA